MYKVENYPQIRDHFYLKGRGAGASKALRGRVAVVTVYARRSPKDWGPAMQAKLRSARQAAGELLVAEAARYGVKLELKFYRAEVNLPADADPKKLCYLHVKEAFQNRTMEELQAHYEKTLNVDEAVLLLAVESPGRSYASMAWQGFQWKGADLPEMSTVLLRPDTTAHHACYLVAHELLHQFGAMDYYFPEEVATWAKRYFKDSIMGVGDGMAVDDLTAYLVGWKDTVSAASWWFLKRTSHITAERFFQMLIAEKTEK